jgi:hypothetical protein
MRRKQKMLLRERAYRGALHAAELEVVSLYLLVHRARGAIDYIPQIDWAEMPVLT